jgi:hypothetical protein
MGPLMFPQDPAGPDLAAEHRALSAWGDALETRHAALLAITDQLNAWFPANQAPESAPGEPVEPVEPAEPMESAAPAVSASASSALTEAYEILWSAYELEQAALNEAFLLLDVGFEVLTEIAERHGVDLDELDDGPGRPWDQDADFA